MEFEDLKMNGSRIKLNLNRVNKYKFKYPFIQITISECRIDKVKSFYFLDLRSQSTMQHHWHERPLCKASTPLLLPQRIKPPNLRQGAEVKDEVQK